MCQAKPGLRCAGHARDKVIKAQADYDNSVESRNPETIDAARKELEHAQFEYDLTPDRLAQITEQDAQRGAYLNDIAQNRKDAVKQINSLDFYDSSQRELEQEYASELRGHDHNHHSLEEYDHTINLLNEQMERTRNDMQQEQGKNTQLRERITDMINSGKRVPGRLWHSVSHVSNLAKVHKEHLGNLKAELERVHDLRKDREPDIPNSATRAAIHPEHLVGTLEDGEPVHGYKDYWLKDDDGNDVAYMRTLEHDAQEGYMDGEPYVVLCDIEVHGDHRGKGYARDIVEQVQHRLNTPLYTTGTFTASGSQRLGHMLPLLPGSEPSNDTGDMRFVHDWENRQPKW